jgi:hypothetical protein
MVVDEEIDHVGQVLSSFLDSTTTSYRFILSRTQ